MVRDMSDDIDDIFDKIRKYFKFNADIFDLDFFVFPEPDLNSEMNPDKTERGFKVSYHYESGMDKPDIKIEGDIDEKKLRDLLKDRNIKVDPKLNKMLKSPIKNGINAEELTLELCKHDDSSCVIEPYTEINDNIEFTEVILEVPGIEKEDIILGINGIDKKLTVSAESPKRKYFKHITIPSNCVMDDYTLELKNGIAILGFKKKVKLD